MISVDVSKIDWTPKTKDTFSIKSEDEDDIHSRQIRGNVYFIDMKLPREVRFAYIREQLQPRNFK